MTTQDCDERRKRAALQFMIELHRAGGKELVDQVAAMVDFFGPDMSARILQIGVPLPEPGTEVTLSASLPVQWYVYDPEGEPEPDLEEDELPAGTRVSVKGYDRGAACLIHEGSTVYAAPDRLLLALVREGSGSAH